MFFNSRLTYVILGGNSIDYVTFTTVRDSNNSSFLSKFFNQTKNYLKYFDNRFINKEIFLVFSLVYWFFEIPITTQEEILKHLSY